MAARVFNALVNSWGCGELKNICIISDPYCDHNEHESRRVAASFLAKRMNSLRKDLYVDEVWMSDLSIICDTDGVRVTLPDGKRISDYDVIYPRVFLERPALVGALLEAISMSSAYTPFDVYGYHSTLHKYLSLLRASKAGIPISPSAISAPSHLTIRQVEQIGLPIVFKRMSGYGGAGVIKASQADELPALLDAFESLNEVLISQKFVQTSHKKGRAEDLRILVVGEETVGIRRRSSGGDFRAGISTGGAPEEFEPEQELREMALTISREMNLDICGIDFIKSVDDGYRFLEVNCTPGMFIRRADGKMLKGIETDIPTLIASHLIRK